MKPELLSIFNAIDDRRQRKFDHQFLVAALVPISVGVVLLAVFNFILWIYCDIL